jgi:hypothetical protein
MPSNIKFINLLRNETWIDFFRMKLLSRTPF